MFVLHKGKYKLKDVYNKSLYTSLFIKKHRKKYPLLEGFNLSSLSPVSTMLSTTSGALNPRFADTYILF